MIKNQFFKKQAAVTISLAVISCFSSHTVFAADEEEEEEKIPTIVKEEKVAGKRFVTWKYLNEWDSRALQLRDFPNAKANWFGQAGIGVQFTYGPMSLDAQVGSFWQTSKGPHSKNVSPETIFNLANEMDPAGFKPKEWMRDLAKAGVDYVVFSAKGEEGFSMWPSKANKFNIGEKHNGRDLVGEFVKAARSAKLKVGLSYSSNNAFFDGPYRDYDGNKDVFLNYKYEVVNPPPTAPADHPTKKNSLIKSEIKELLTNYGKIDVFYPKGSLGGLTVNQLRKVNPTMAIANTSMGQKGDFVHLSNTWTAVPARLAIINENEWPWEAQRPFTKGSTYHTTISTAHLDSKLLLNAILDVRSKGGNILLNIALSPDGSMPSGIKTIFEDLGDWMKENEDAFTEITAGMPPIGKKAAPVLLKENKGYVFLQTWKGSSADPIRLKGLPKPSSIKGLAEGGKVEFEYDKDEKKLEFHVQEGFQRSKIGGEVVMSVLEMKFKEDVAEKYKFPAIKGFAAKK